MKTQRQAALETANERRVKRAELKTLLATGEADVADYVYGTPSWLETAKIWDMIRASWGIGPKTAEMILFRSGIPTLRRFNELTDRQRDVLVHRLRTKDYVRTGERRSGY